MSNPRADESTALNTKDFEQVDVNRRVFITGRDAWRDQTIRINGAHESMGRLHHGRALVGEWLVVELEWFGTVRGDALGRPGETIDISTDWNLVIPQASNGAGSHSGTLTANTVRSMNQVHRVAAVRAVAGRDVMHASPGHRRRAETCSAGGASAAA